MPQTFDQIRKMSLSNPIIISNLDPVTLDLLSNAIMTLNTGTRKTCTNSENHVQAAPHGTSLIWVCTVCHSTNWAFDEA